MLQFIIINNKLINKKWRWVTLYKKRGQAATEYIIILAVVVIIALIVVGVLGGFPAIGRGSSARTSAAYWASAPIGIVSYDLSDTVASNSIRVVNNLRSKITVTSIKFGATADNVADTTLQAGETKTVALTTLTCTAGETYGYTVDVTYTNDDTGEAGLIFTGDVDLTGECLNI
jgi:uncharacterized protein (UPF0333 family)